MSSLDHAQSLSDGGMFNEALAVLRGGSIPRDRRLRADLLRAELLERTGHYEESGALVHAVLNQADTSGVDEGRCHMILGRIAAANGHFEVAADQLQRSIRAAMFRRDFERAAWSQLR